MSTSAFYTTSAKDWELRSGIVTLKGRRGWASSVTSILINGTEVCAGADRGRYLQSSCNADRNLGGPTDWNPTEQGSQDDSTGSTTESMCTRVELTPDGTQVRTTVQAAYWFGPGDAGASAAADTQPSPVIMRKTYTASYGGQAGLFRILVEYIIPTKVNIQAKKLFQMEALTAYLINNGTPAMNVVEDWDYATETLSTVAAGDMLPAGPVFRSARPVVSKVGGAFCVALYSVTKSSDASGLATDGNAPALMNRAGDYRIVDYTPTAITNPDVQITWNYAAGIPAGTYSAEVFLCAGTTAMVTTASTGHLGWLKANRPSP